MLSIQKVSQITQSLQCSLLSLINRNIMLEQKITSYEKLNSQNQTLKIKIIELNSIIQNSTQLLELKQKQQLLLNNQLKKNKQQLSEVQQNLEACLKCINQKDEKISNLTLSLLQMQELKKANAKIFVEITQLRKDKEELKAELQTQYSQRAQKSQINLILPDQKLKSQKLCQKCKPKVNILFKNKMNTIESLQNQIINLNKYLTEVTSDNKYAKNIKTKLIQVQINQCLLNFETEIKKQLQLYIECQDKYRTKIINNINIYIRNLRKQIEYSMFGR